MQKNIPILILLLLALLAAFTGSCSRHCEERSNPASGIETSQRHVAALRAAIDRTLYAHPDSTPALLRQLEAQARAAGDHKHVAYALNRYAALHFPDFNTDSIYHYAALAEDYARRHQQYPQLFNTLHTLALRYSNETRYAEALATTRRMADEARQVDNPRYTATALAAMGNIYWKLGHDQEAISNYAQSIAELRNYPGYEELGLTVENYNGIARICLYLERYEDALHYLDTMRTYIDIREAAGHHDENFRIEDAVNSAKAYIRLDSLDAATPHYRYLKENITPHLPLSYMLHLYEVETEYQMLRGNYTEALAAADAYMEVARELELPTVITTATKTHADILMHLRRPAEAAPLYATALERYMADEHESHQRRLTEIRTLYEVDRLQMKTEQAHESLRQTRRTAVAIAIIALLLSVIAVVSTLYSRRLRRKNIRLVERIREQDRLEKAVEKLSAADPEQSPLYTRLVALMKDEQLYTNPQINRRTVAEALGTNETYLIDAIKKDSGYSFNEYITRLRLDHARNLIEQESERLMSTETIAFESGFSSRSTFFRQFKDKYDMTPEEYRRISSGNVPRR